MNYIIFHQDFSKLAGTERVLFNIIEHLLSNDLNKVTLVLCSSKKELIFGLEKLPIQIVFLNQDLQNDSRLGLAKYYINIGLKINKYFSALDRKMEHVVLSSNYMLGALVYFSGKSNKNIRFISCEHFSFHISGFFSKFIRSIYYKNVSVVLLTEKDCEIVNNKYSPKICICIPNAIPFDLHEYVDNTKTILSIGRLTYQKGFDLLIDSFSLISEKYPDWTLKIIGDDYGDKQLLLDKIDQFNLKNVFIFPSTSNIQDEYKNAAFYVMSSRFEGLPMVLLEAMAFGLPLVSFDCPTGPSEVVDDDNGILVPDGNIELLADAIELLINNSELRKMKSNGSHNKALKFSKTNINKNWDNLFSEIWEVN